MSKEKKVTIEFRDLTFERLLAKSWPAGTRVDSEPFRALGVMWRLMVWPTGSTPGNSVQVALTLAEPERTITPERVTMSFPGLKASTSCKLPTLSSAAKPPPGLDTQTRMLSVVIPFDELRSLPSFSFGAAHAGVLTATRFLTASVAMQAAKAGAAAAAAAEAWLIPKSSALSAQLCALYETMDGADVTVAVDAAGEAEAAEAPLQVHSFMLLLRCGARAALGAMAAPGPRSAPFTLMAPQLVGAEAMKAFVHSSFTRTRCRRRCRTPRCARCS